MAQGIVQIKRTKISKEGEPAEPIYLDYLPHDKFKALVDSNDEKALDYYSFDEGSGYVYYATYREEITTVNGAVTDTSYVLTENTMSYKSITNMCSMPYNFLFALLQESQNPEYVMAVADLILENSEVVLMIQDQLNISTYTEVETSYHVQKVVVSTEAGTSVSYTYPYGAANVITTVTTTYSNTATAFIQKANTWCLDFEQEATPSNTNTPGTFSTEYEEYSNSNFASLGYTLVSSSETVSRYVSTSDLLYSTATKYDTKNFGWTVGIKTEKRINHEKFLGLWKNAEGEYSLGCVFDENGKEVGYPLPEDNAKAYPARDISEENEQHIDELIGLLGLHEDTQVHEQLMMYYWNTYFGEKVYDVDLEALLDLFNTEAFVSTGSSSYGSIMDLIRSHLGAHEGTGEIREIDGVKYYVVYADTVASDLLSFGHGMTIWKKNDFERYGYPINGLKVGDLLPVEVVDAVQDMTLSEHIEVLKADQRLAGLTDYQYAALTLAWWSNPSFESEIRAKIPTLWKESDNKYGEPIPGPIPAFGSAAAGAPSEAKMAQTKAWLNCDLYTQKWGGCYKSKAKNGTLLARIALVRRRYCEFLLFQYGYDFVTDSYYKASVSDGDLYNSDGSVNEEAIYSLELQLAQYIGLENEVQKVANGRIFTNWGMEFIGRGGTNPDAVKNKLKNLGVKWYGTTYNTSMSLPRNYWLQCVWWAKGRGSQYLEERYGVTLSSSFNGKISGDGGRWYNNCAPYFERGQTPKPHSIVSWTQGGKAGHVAYVEAVDTVNKYVYISHAGRRKALVWNY